SHQINFFLFLKGIDVARDVEVVVVLFDFIEAGDVGVFFHVVAGEVGFHNFADIVVAEQVLVFSGFKVAAGVDKHHAVVAFVFLKNQNRRRNAGAVEQFFRQADYGIEQVFFDQLLTDFAFAGTPEQYAVRHHHTHSPCFGFQGFDHVQDKGIVAFGFWRYTSAETAELVVFRFVVAPFIQAERWVGGNNVEQHQVAVFIQQLGVADGVAPFNLVIVFAVQKHVHFGQRPGGANGLLPIQGVLLAAVVGHNFAAAFH